VDNGQNFSFLELLNGNYYNSSRSNLCLKQTFLSDLNLNIGYHAQCVKRPGKTCLTPFSQNVLFD
jgi:hypothetical protein